MAYLWLGLVVAGLLALDVAWASITDDDAGFFGLCAILVAISGLTTLITIDLIK